MKSMMELKVKTKNGSPHVVRLNPDFIAMVEARIVNGQTVLNECGIMLVSGTAIHCLHSPDFVAQLWASSQGAGS